MPVCKTVTKIVNGKVLQIQVKAMPRWQTTTSTGSAAAASASTSSSSKVDATAAKATQAEAAQGFTAYTVKMKAMPPLPSIRVRLDSCLVCGKDMESEDDEAFFTGKEGEISPLPDWD